MVMEHCHYGEFSAAGFCVDLIRHVDALALPNKPTSEPPINNRVEAGDSDLRVVVPVHTVRRWHLKGPTQYTL